MNLQEMHTWEPDSGTLNIVIETSKGSRNKFRYDPAQELFVLSKVLPQGLVFPFNFGFIPSTIGDDGDPLDVLILLNEPVSAGCKIPARLIGVIEANQTEDGKTERNDRLVAVAEDNHDHRDIRSLKDLNASLLEQIERFFVSCDELEKKEFKPVARRGPHHAAKLVKQAAKRFRDQHRQETAESKRNGRRKRSKDS